MTMRAKILAGFVGGLLIGVLLLLVERDRRQEQESVAAGQEAPDPQAIADVARQVQQGGLILHFRHGNRQKCDSVIAFDVYEMATRTDGAESTHKDAICLSPQGVEEAKMIGEIFRLGRIPVGPVVAGPSCRTRRTAMLAFGRIDTISNGLAHTPVVNRRNADAFYEELRRATSSAAIRTARSTCSNGSTIWACWRRIPSISTPRRRRSSRLPARPSWSRPRPVSAVPRT